MVAGARRQLSWEPWPWAPLVSCALGLFEAGRCPAAPQPELTRALPTSGSPPRAGFGETGAPAPSEHKSQKVK